MPNNDSISNERYGEMVRQASPNSKSYKTIPMAFLIGGLICVLGQLLIDGYAALGIEQQLCAPAASCTLVFLSALLTGFNVFDDLAKHAGAGTLVPITGFANAVAAPALEFKTEGLILGVGAKMFIIAGPVIVYGLAASAVYGVIVYFFKG
ncbi:MAG: stage V sporulation protein AC [Oscillospiraceae bacterium]